MREKGKKPQKGTAWEKRSSRAAEKGSRGNCPLQGQGAELPCGVWGNAPTVPRATSMPNVLNKGAGSEASLPVTLRVRRRAPKLLYPQLAYCRAKWARPSSWSYNQSCSFAQAGISPLRRRPKGNENRRSLRSPPTPLRSALSCFLDFSAAEKSLCCLTLMVGRKIALAGVNPAIIALLWGENPR